MCKTSLLKEYVLKKKLTDPASSDAVYGSSKVAAESQMTLWLSTVTLDDQTYIGDIARTKRLSARNAASTAVRSMLEAGNDLMIKIVLAKRLRLEVPRKKKRKHAAARRKEAAGFFEEKEKREIVAEQVELVCC